MVPIKPKHFRFLQFIWYDLQHMAATSVTGTAQGSINLNVTELRDYLQNHFNSNCIPTPTRRSVDKDDSGSPTSSQSQLSGSETSPAVSRASESHPKKRCKTAGALRVTETGTLNASVESPTPTSAGISTTSRCRRNLENFPKERRKTKMGFIICSHHQLRDSLLDCGTVLRSPQCLW